ncbi:MAG: enoyl-CoA hydratase family protein [Pseudomonadota bacterium]|nr:enoyl-CoA hydratase family protein [Pseudomonadota bacterium]
MTDLPFRVDLADGVAVVTLDRPDRLNALTFAVYEALAAWFRAPPAGTRAVVITGAGRGFCSGGDVEDIIAKLFALDAEGLLAFTRMTGALVRAMRACPAPVVAAINGVAAGAGAIIAMASDLRVGSTTARVSFLFNKVGLSGADMGACHLLPRIVGHGRAAELLYLGDVIGADEAHRIGFLNRVVAPEALLTEALGIARRIASGPAFANGVTKTQLDREMDVSLDAAIEMEAQAQALCMLHPDFREAHLAWKESRKPQYR